MHKESSVFGLKMDSGNFQWSDWMQIFLNCHQYFFKIKTLILKINGDFFHLKEIPVFENSAKLSGHIEV